MAHFARDTIGHEVVESLKDHIKGKTILITGTSAGGLGAETALSLAHGSPAHLLLLGRSEAKVSPVIEQIKGLNPSIKTAFIPVELDSQASVRDAASMVQRQVDKLDIVINNAGVMAVKEYTTSAEGIESQFATNHVSHFLLTNLLMDKILAAAASVTGETRIVNVTSDGYTISPVRLDDWNFSNGTRYDPWSAYGQSKTANILFTVELARRLKDRGVQCFAVHPGVIFETKLAKHVSQEMFGEISSITEKNTGSPFVMGTPKSIQQGVATALIAALDPSIAGQTGSYMRDAAIHPAREYATSASNAEELWALSERLVGETFAF